MANTGASCVLAAALAAVSPCGDGAAAAARPVPVTALGSLPLPFETNRGQADPRFDFLARGPGYGLYLSPAEAVLVLGTPGDGLTAPAIVHMQMAGADLSARPTAHDRLPGASNYFIGNRPARWRTGIPRHGRVEYRGVYPGVDLVYRGNRGQLEYDFVVSPGADPGRIQLAFEGAEGLRLDGEGNLVVSVRGGEVVQHAPVAYQETDDGIRTPVLASYELRGPREVGFAVPGHDPACGLVIDPVLVYSSYLGGSDQDDATGIAVDPSGNLYVAGRTASTDFPTAGPFQGVGAGLWDAFVVKLDATGSAVSYATYLGGGGSDSARGIAVDASGRAYLTGDTDSTDFPTRNPLQPGNASPLGWDAFVTRLDATGSALDYSTYLGGGGADQGRAIAVDTAGRAYVAGSTGSTDFPTRGPFQGQLAGAEDAFVARLNAGGSALDYSTYLGGRGTDIAHGIAVDGTGSAHVTGFTDSTDFPTANPYQATLAGPVDAFVTRLNGAGSALGYSTYLGGSGSEYAYGIAVDGAGNAYLTGDTDSTDFPVKNAIQGQNAGWEDAFVTRLGSTGSVLDYSTYLGGSDGDWAFAIAVTAAGAVSIAGRTASADFPTFAAPQAAYGGGPEDAFAVWLTPTGSTLVFSTFLGGSEDDAGYGVGIDTQGHACVAGSTASSDFPTRSPFQGSNAGGADAFVARLEGTAPSCALAAAVVRGLLAVRKATARADIEMSWRQDFAANGYNVWYVTARSDVPLASQANQAPGGPARPVGGCAVPAPAPGTTCTDRGAVLRDTSVPFYYQVRVYCDPATEGP